MGGGSSKTNTLQAKVKAHGAIKTSSFKRKANSSSNSISFGSVNSSSYVPTPASKDLAVLHVRPGSNAMTIDWMLYNDKNCQVTGNADRDSKQIPILTRESNGGGTVDDITFLDDAAKNIALACTKTKALTVIIDVMTVEGQALLNFFWADNLWLKTSNSTIVLILPTFSHERAGMKTTHPSLYGPAHAPLHAAVALGTCFGSSFQSTKKKKIPEAKGTSIAFVPRHVWYANTDPVTKIITLVLSRLYLRLKLRQEWANKKTKNTTVDETYGNVEQEYKRLQALYTNTKEKREQLLERALQRKQQDALKRSSRKKAIANAKETEFENRRAAKEHEMEQKNNKDKAKQEWINANQTEAVMLPVEQSGEWSQHVDPATGHHYYINSITNETSWTKPNEFGDQEHEIKQVDPETRSQAAQGSEHMQTQDPNNTIAESPLAQDDPGATLLPVEQSGEWSQHVDPATGHHYYINSITSETSWTKPNEFGDQEHEIKQVDPETLNQAANAAKKATPSVSNASPTTKNEQTRQPERTPTKRKGKRRQRKKSGSSFKVAGSVDEDDLDAFEMDDGTGEFDAFEMEEEYSDEDETYEGDDVEDFALGFATTNASSAATTTVENNKEDNTVGGNWDVNVDDGVEKSKRQTNAEEYAVGDLVVFQRSKKPKRAEIISIEPGGYMIQFLQKKAYKIKFSTPEFLTLLPSTGASTKEEKELDNYAMDMQDSTNVLEDDYEMAMATINGDNTAQSSSLLPTLPTFKSCTAPTNTLYKHYQTVGTKTEEQEGVATKSDEPEGHDQREWENIGTLWCDIALKNVRMKQQQSKKTTPPVEPMCEMIFYSGSRPEHYSGFLTISLERLVMHQNAYSEGVTVTQDDVETSLDQLSKLWASTWQYMYVEGEVVDEDQIAQEEMAIAAGGTPGEFSREYCQHLPLGDIGTWPSGGIVLAAAGSNASKLVKASQSEVEYMHQNDSTTTTSSSAVPRLRQEIEYAYSLDKLLQLKTWKDASSDCILVVDVHDDPVPTIAFLVAQSKLKQQCREKMINGEDFDTPQSIVVALLLPPAQDHGPQWANAAQILATDMMYPGGIDLMVLMQAGLSANTASCLTSMVRCPVDFSAVCKHMTPFPKIHHAIGFVAKINGATGETGVGCLVDTTGLYDGAPEDQDMSVYCSYSIYSGPGGYADGFCVDGDAKDNPRRIIAQIIGQTHASAPVANAGYGVAASNAVMTKDANSVWTVLATIPSTMTDVLLRTLTGADACWDVEKMDSEFAALGELRSAYVEVFASPADEEDQAWSPY